MDNLNIDPFNIEEILDQPILPIAPKKEVIYRQEQLSPVPIEDSLKHYDMEFYTNPKTVAFMGANMIELKSKVQLDLDNTIKIIGSNYNDINVIPQNVLSVNNNTPITINSLIDASNNNDRILLNYIRSIVAYDDSSFIFHLTENALINNKYNDCVAKVLVDNTINNINKATNSNLTQMSFNDRLSLLENHFSTGDSNNYISGHTFSNNIDILNDVGSNNNSIVNAFKNTGINNNQAMAFLKCMISRGNPNNYNNFTNINVQPLVDMLYKLKTVLTYAKDINAKAIIALFDERYLHLDSIIQNKVLDLINQGTNVLEYLAEPLIGWMNNTTSNQCVDRLLDPIRIKLSNTLLKSRNDFELNLFNIFQNSKINKTVTNALNDNIFNNNITNYQLVEIINSLINILLTVQSTQTIGDVIDLIINNVNNNNISRKSRNWDNIEVKRAR
jgi:hypothetical protein